MHVFVEAARTTLQNLWDELFFSEEQMAEFTPAFNGKHYIRAC
jgi:Ase1/PRC1/MAP65 family protein